MPTKLIAIAPCFSKALRAPDTESLASILDRDWFKANRTRRHRIRSAIPGELPGVTDAHCVAVRHVTHGIRIRLPFLADRRLPCREETEEFAARVFERLGEDIRSRGFQPNATQSSPLDRLQGEAL